MNKMSDLLFTFIFYYSIGPKPRIPSENKVTPYKLRITKVIVFQFHKNVYSHASAEIFPSLNI